MWFHVQTATTALLALATLGVARQPQQQQSLTADREDGSSATAGLLDLHRELVQLSSISGTEHNISAWLATYLKSRNYTVELQDVHDNGRQNVFAYLGSERQTRVLVTSHIDTVPPFIDYSRRGEELRGRGSADAKGSVASQIIAVEALRKTKEISNEGGDVALLFVVGEEYGGAGMKAANDLNLEWEAAIFGEPTELKLARGHKGGTAFVVSAHGKAGHSGYPERGRNAIDELVKGLAALQRIDLPGSEEFGDTTLNVGLIEGGAAANVIPAAANATVLIRIASNDLAQIKKQVHNVILGASPWLTIEWSAYGRAPVRIDYDIEGFETFVANYGTDIVNLQGDHKRYLYGPGSILVAHSDHEFLHVSDLEEAVHGYQRLIKDVLKRSPTV